MPRQLLNLVGEKYNLLTVIEEATPILRPNGGKRRRWLCSCDCGNEIIVRQESLKSGQQSCGCVQKASDIIGEVYGRLTVIEEVEPYISSKGKKSRSYKCQCNCGNEIITRRSCLLSGATQSCGCLFKELSGNTTHGHTFSRKPTKEYRSWQSMKARCCNSNHKSYKNYGGRGITVCERWKYSFEAFLSDMGDAPSKTSTIERIDTNGDYEPSNCVWLDACLQYKTKRTTKLNDDLVRYVREQRALGVSVYQLAEELGVNKSTIYSVAKGTRWKDVV